MLREYKCALPLSSVRWLAVLGRLVGLTAILLCLLAWASPARAESSEADRATARALAAEGYQALQKKDYQTAEDRFRRADALVHAPSLVVDHARALVGLGRLVEAHERYQLVMREGVPLGSPMAWRRALGDAERELKVLEPRLAWVTVTVKGPTEPAAVLVDDRPVPPAALGVRRATDPGSRRVSASAPGFAPAGQVVTLGEGEEKALELELLPAPAAPTPPQAAPAPLPSVVPENPQPKRRSNTIAYAALGLGGAGLVAGAVTGVLFLGKHSELASKCPDASNCSEQRLIDQYNRYGTISAVSFGVGVAGTVAGIWLLLSRKAGETPPRPSAVVVQPYVSIGHLGLTGAF
jgi:hypothetical protein